MPCDFSLRLVGGLPDFAGWSGYPSIAAFLINPGIDAMGHKETSRPAGRASVPKARDELTMLFKPFRPLGCDYLHAQLNAFITNNSCGLLALRVH